MNAGDALLDSLPRTTFVVGKGGVGKTTCASALALRAGERFGRTLLLSTDPARALPTVVGEEVGADAAPLGASPAVDARILDAGALRARFLDRWGDVLRVIIDRGTYLDEADIGPLVDTALPGGDEIFAALALAEQFASETASHARVFIDTAPTGHTLRLLALPRTFRALVRLLDAMQAKHRYLVRTLTRAYRADDADAFLAEVTRLVSALEEALRDPGRCAAVMVTAPQPMVLEETRRYLAALCDLGVETRAIVWNAGDAPGGPLDAPAQYVVPRLPEWPVGGAGLRRWFHAIAVAPAAQRAPRRPARRRGGPHSDFAALMRPLTIVAGKGGVGKTTVACVLALNADGPTLIVSTDPAPSLADALLQPIPDAETPIAGAPKLRARQMDATAAFDRLRTEYSARVDALFDTFVGKGVDMSQDRAILRDLMALAPPGVDEVYALTLLADALRGQDGQRVIVDPAPTGHLLRLLEMPQLALAWTHQLMRLMLRYKDVAGLGDTARDLLDFSKDLRALDALLRDERRCAVVLVTLDEPVVLAETSRLAAAIRERGVHVSGVVRNRAVVPAPSRAGSPLPVPDAPMHFEAPEVHPPPAGLAPLREWAATWSASGDARTPARRPPPRRT